MRILQRTNYFWYTFGYTRFYFSPYTSYFNGAYLVIPSGDVYYYGNSYVSDSYGRKSPSMFSIDYACYVDYYGGIVYDNRNDVDRSYGRKKSPNTNSSYAWKVHPYGIVFRDDYNGVSNSYGKKTRYTIFQVYLVSF